MRDDENFALVLRAGKRGIASGCPYDYAVCIVEGESARTVFVDLEGLGRAVGDLPCVPSIYGKKTGIVSYETEMEAVDTLVKAAEEFSLKYNAPKLPQYDRIREHVTGGVRASIVDGRISLEIAQWLTEALSWYQGDRIDLAVRADGKHFQIFADRDGSAIEAGTTPGWVTTARDWPLDRGVGFVDGEYLVSHCVANGTLLFELTTPSPEFENNPPEQTVTVTPLPPRLPIDYRWSMIGLSICYFVISAVLKLS